MRVMFSKKLGNKEEEVGSRERGWKKVKDREETREKREEGKLNNLQTT